MKRFLSILTVAVCMFSLCSGCKVSKQDVTLDVAVGGSTHYTIIRAEDATYGVCKITDKLRKAMSEIANNVAVCTDYVFESGSASEYEIIIGSTNRDESKTVLSGLKYDDYKITIVDKKIVIAAHSETALDSAVTHFIEKTLSRAKDGNLKVTSGDEHSYKHKYPVKKAKIGGVDLKEFEIVLPSEQSPELVRCAEYLKKSLRSAAGIELSVANGSAGYSKYEITLVSGDCEDGKYSIEVGDGKASITTAYDEFTMRKAIDDFVTTIKKKGKPVSKTASATSKKLLTSACFSDAHNSLAMLLPDNNTGDYVLRKTHTNAINLLLGTKGKVDVVLVGGDLMSDFPYWNRSGHLPYKNYLDFKKLIVKEYARLAKDEKVMYIAGNHDYAQGELSTDGPGTDGAYNSCEFYFSGPMNEKIGELSDVDMHWITGAYTGEKYLLGYHYEINGVHFIGLSPDPDSPDVRSVQGYGFHPETLTWFKATLDRIDPCGNEVIFVNCHYIMAYRSNDKIRIGGEADADILPIIKNHGNLFWLFGHVHSGVSNIAQSHTSEMIVHYDSDGEPCSTPAIARDYTKNVNKGPTTVYMGAGRIGYTDKYFGDDIVTGNVGHHSLNRHPSTATPTVCQVMYFTVYEDRVEFQSVNAGTHEGYTKDDIIEPYTVYLY